jgi:hypothetical protein
MKQKSQSTEAVHTSGQRSWMQFGQVPPNAWKISGKTLTLDEFIDNHRQEIVSADLQVLRTFTDDAKRKAIYWLHLQRRA